MIIDTDNARPCPCGEEALCLRVRGDDGNLVRSVHALHAETSCGWQIEFEARNVIAQAVGARCKSLGRMALRAWNAAQRADDKERKE